MSFLDVHSDEFEQLFENVNFDKKIMIPIKLDLSQDQELDFQMTSFFDTYKLDKKLNKDYVYVDYLFIETLFDIHFATQGLRAQSFDNLYQVIENMLKINASESWREKMNELGICRYKHFLSIQSINKAFSQLPYEEEPPMLSDDVRLISHESRKRKWTSEEVFDSMERHLKVRLDVVNRLQIRRS